jgi:hypothetical protein
MRCLACNVALSDFESTRKYTSGGYVDLCNKCFYSGVHQQVYVSEREDLRGTVDVDDDQEINDD